MGTTIGLIILIALFYTEYWYIPVCIMALIFGIPLLVLLKYKIEGSKVVKPRPSVTTLGTTKSFGIHNNQTASSTSAFSQNNGSSKHNILNFGNIENFKPRSSTCCNYGFPIISEGVQANRSAFVNFILNNDLRVSNPKYDDEEYWKKRKSSQPVYKYEKTYIDGKLEWHHVYVPNYYNYENDDVNDDDYEDHYYVYVSLDGTNWVHIGRAPVGKMWEEDFCGGMHIDVEISGGEYKYKSGNTILTGNKQIYVYGKFTK